MKILLLLLQMPEEGQASDMYVDLAEEFVKNGHEMTIMAPDNEHSNTFIRRERGMRVIRVDSWQTQGVKNLFKKGLALATMASHYKKAFKEYLKGEKFDWIIMPTPPITLIDFVKEIKTETGAKFYLILRDIHPQSVQSIGLLKFKWQYYYLEKCAKKGYEISDKIGCMSQGNVDFIAKNYTELDKSKLVILYNWLKNDPTEESHEDIRAKYGYEGKFITLFGGTIGLGQRIENIVALAEHYLWNPQIVFLIIGEGIEKERLEHIANDRNLTNIHFMDFMPQKDYLEFVKSVDLGLITINENYTVPTCPSKAVSYMSMGIPVFAMINPNSDYGQWIEDAGAGYWTVGSDKDKAFKLFDKLYEDADLRREMSKKGRDYYQANLTEKAAYKTMISQMK